MKKLFTRSRLMTLIATLLLTAAVASAQTNFKVTGKVTDEEGEVLIGVSIKASNSKAGASCSNSPLIVSHPTPKGGGLRALLIIRRCPLLFLLSGLLGTIPDRAT